MNEIETAGVVIGFVLLVVEATVLIRMQSHVRELQELAKKIDNHMARMDGHIGQMDDRVGKVKTDIALVCNHFGVDSDAHEK